MKKIIFTLTALSIIFILTIPAFSQNSWQEGVEAMHKVWYISNTQAVTTPGKVMPGWRMANTTGFTIQIPQDWSEYGDGFYEPWCAAPPEYDKEIGIFLNLNLTPGLSLDEMTAGLITDMFGLDDYTIIYTDSVVNPFISTGFGQSGLSSFTAFTFNYNGQEALGVFCYTILLSLTVGFSRILA